MTNNSFITSHGSLLKDRDRIRVSQQLLTILEDWYGGKNLRDLVILDYGCSNGVITNYIANYVKNAYGVDVDKIAIKEAKQRFQSYKLTFNLTKNERIPYKDSIFDLVICNQVYSYLDNPELMSQEIFRVLKKDGICLFTGDNLFRIIEPLYNLPFIRLLPQNITRILLQFLGYKKIYMGKYKSYWELKKLFKKFMIVDYSTKVLKNPKQFKYKKLMKYNNIISLIPDFLVKTLEPFFPSFIFILKK